MFLSRISFGLTLIGTPSATLDEGKYEFSFNYLRSDMDIEISTHGLTGILDTEINSYLPKLDIGLGDDWQLSLGLGIACMDADGFSDDNGFGGIGLKKTIARQGDIDWGASIQIYWFSFYDEMIILPPYTSKIDISCHEVQLAFGPTYSKGDLCIYGGPFLHYLDGDADVNDVRGDFSLDVEKDLSIGAFVGFTTKIANNVDFGFEAQFIEDAQALVFRFRYLF